MKQNGVGVLLLVVVLACLAATAQTADPCTLRGFVADSRGGERLERVRVRLLPVVNGVPQRPGAPGSAPVIEAVTNARGEFALESVPPGEYELAVSTVGYRIYRQTLTLAAQQKLEFEIALSPEAFTQRETIDVNERVFDPLQSMAPTERTLTHSEVKNLGSVLADDPLRAVQAMPGVSVGDDFEARFELRGAPFENIGIFLDGVLMHAPFQTVHDDNPSGSMTMLNGDLIENLALLTGGFSAKYGNRTAGVVAITSREGGRDRIATRVTASMSNAGVLVEGPLGSARKGSWVAGVRKSYLQYIIQRTSSDASMAFGFTDGQGRAVYDLTPRVQLSFEAASGASALDRSHFKSQISPRGIMTTDGRQSVGILGLRYTQGQNFLFNATLGLVHETYKQWNPSNVPLTTGRYQDVSGRAEGTWYWRRGAALELGAETRVFHDESVLSDYTYTAPAHYFEYDRFKGGASLTSGYAQQTWQYKRLRLGAGVRVDQLKPDSCATAAKPNCIVQSPTTYSPRVSLAIPLPANQSLRLGWGQYRQFPEMDALYGTVGNPRLSPQRATHYVAAWEWQIHERTRVSVEGFDREDRQGITQPWFQPRWLSTNKFYNYNYAAPFQNSLVGYSRGVEFLVQRRSANRLTGWLSYSYMKTHVRDTITGSRSVAEYDQPHTFNAYASYRVRSSVNLSARWVNGSGFPVPAYVRQSGTSYYLMADPYRVRLQPYQRLDARINKTLLYAHRRLTLYGEVVNVLNHRNLRFSDLSSINSKTGLTSIRFDRMFPIIPSVGAVFEF